MTVLLARPKAPPTERLPQFKKHNEEPRSETPQPGESRTPDVETISEPPLDLFTLPRPWTCESTPGPNTYEPELMGYSCEPRHRHGRRTEWLWWSQQESSENNEPASLVDSSTRWDHFFLRKCVRDQSLTPTLFVEQASTKSEELRLQTAMYCYRFHRIKNKASSIPFVETVPIMSDGNAMAHISILEPSSIDNVRDTEANCWLEASDKPLPSWPVALRSFASLSDLPAIRRCPASLWHLNAEKIRVDHHAHVVLELLQHPAQGCGDHWITKANLMNAIHCGQIRWWQDPVLLKLPAIQSFESDRRRKGLDKPQPSWRVVVRSFASLSDLPAIKRSPTSLWYIDAGDLRVGKDSQRVLALLQQLTQGLGSHSVALFVVGTGTQPEILYCRESQAGAKTLRQLATLGATYIARPDSLEGDSLTERLRAILAPIFEPLRRYAAEGFPAPSPPARRDGLETAYVASPDDGPVDRYWLTRLLPHH